MGCQRIDTKHFESRRGRQLCCRGLSGMKQPAVGGEYRDRRIEPGDEAPHALFQRQRRPGGFCRHDKNGGGAVRQRNARTAAGEAARGFRSEIGQAFKPRDAVGRQGGGNAGDLLRGGIIGVETTAGERCGSLGVEDRSAYCVGPQDVRSIHRPEPRRRCRDSMG